MNKINDKILQQRKSAQHGDFFFARVYVVTGNYRNSPVFIVSNDNDDEDVIVCICTKQPPKTDFDVEVQLKMKSYVRTNKIYTIKREQLAFKIPQTVSSNEYKKIIGKISEALNITSVRVITDNNLRT